MAVETPEFLAMLSRLIKAAGKRVADGDEPELKALIQCQADLDSAIATGVAGMRERGCSWAYIAQATGTTRQAAHLRWGKAS